MLRNKTEDSHLKILPFYLLFKISTGLLERRGLGLCYVRADNGNNPGPKD